LRGTVSPWIAIHGLGDDGMGLLEKKPLRRALAHWRARHQHPVNFALHLVGIPLAVTGVVLFFAWPWDEWYWGVGCFVLGYLLQWVGHWIEGNDLGEWAGVKRLLGKPYVSISPRYAAPHKPDSVT